MVVFLKPKKAPIQIFGAESMQKTKSKMIKVGKGTAPDEDSIQLAKLIIKNITNIKVGKIIEVSMARTNH
jgi:hypothetical protein